jgi:hypothetical protein
LRFSDNIYELIFQIIAILEPFHPAHRIDNSLFACIEGVAFAAYFNLEFRRSGASGESITAMASNFGIFVVSGMNFIFHRIR